MGLPTGAFEGLGILEREGFFAIGALLPILGLLGASGFEVCFGLTTSGLLGGEGRGIGVFDGCLTDEVNEGF